MQTAKTLVPAIALAAFIGLPLAAQQPTPTPGEQQPGTPHPGTVPPSNQPAPPSAPSPHGTPQAGSPADSVPSTANSPEISNPDLRPVTGELVSKLDTQDAKSG